MVKIDMAKTYDRVYLNFLFAGLLRCGFSHQFSKLVEECVKSPRYFMIMNGSYKGFASLVEDFGKVIFYLHIYLF